MAGLWMLALLACEPSLELALSDQTQEAVLQDLTVETEWRTCSVDEDCVWIDLDCCGCQSGGLSLALAATQVEAFETANPANCEDALDCPTVYECGDEPVCRMQHCVAPR